MCIQYAAAQADAFTKVLTEQWATKTPQEAFDFLDERTPVLRAQLLEKGQVLAGEGAQEVRLDHPEPTRDRACTSS